MADVLHFDQSTWLARQVVDSKNVVNAPPPPFVALPGARQAIPADRLAAHHEQGDQELEIVDRVNTGWDRENGQAVDAMREWAQGPYQQALREMREQAAEKAARELRRQAALERLADQRAGEE